MNDKIRLQVCKSCGSEVEIVMRHGILRDEDAVLLCETCYEEVMESKAHIERMIGREGAKSTD